MPRWAKTALMIVVMAAAIVWTAARADATSPLPAGPCRSVAPHQVVQGLSATTHVSCTQARAGRALLADSSPDGPQRPDRWHPLAVQLLLRV